MLGDVEETLTIHEIDEETEEEIVKVYLLSFPPGLYLIFLIYVRAPPVDADLQEKHGHAVRQRRRHRPRLPPAEDDVVGGCCGAVSCRTRQATERFV